MEVLAINGGRPVRQKAFSPWPVWDDGAEEALKQVLHSGCWSLGDRVKRFEREFAVFQGARFGTATSSGTGALELAMESLDLPAGAEVILPAYTFMATAYAVVKAGGLPVFADIDRSTYNVDPAAVEAAITPRTRAIVAVHIGGRPADMDALLALASKHGLALVEDAAQAHAAEWRGERVGALGDIGIFSFQGSKNLAAGEGGFIATNAEELFRRAWSLANCGRAPDGPWYQHDLLGGNHRMTEFQAGLLSRQLRCVERQTALRNRNAKTLTDLLREVDGVETLVADDRVTRNAYHLYIFRLSPEAFAGIGKERFIEALKAEGVRCSAGYRPLYGEKAFDRLFAERFRDPHRHAVHCPETERAFTDEGIWLAQNLLLGDREDILDIAAAVEKVCANRDELVASAGGRVAGGFPAQNVPMGSL